MSLPLACVIAPATPAGSHCGTRTLDNDTSKNLSAPAGHSTTHIMALESIPLATTLKLSIDLLGSGDIVPTSAASILATAQALSNEPLQCRLQMNMLDKGLPVYYTITST